jgi:Na+/H+ antiporter NhaA
VAVPAVAEAASAQEAAGVNVPVELDAKVTLPVGVITVPAVEVSVTVAVQLVPWFTTTEAGVHDTLVDVVRGLTVTGKGAIVALAAWEVSPG